MVKQYSFIYDPVTNQKISIFSNNGRKLLQNYIRLNKATKNNAKLSINGGAYMTRSRTKALKEKKATNAAKKKKNTNTAKKKTTNIAKKKTTNTAKKKTTKKKNANTTKKKKTTAKKKKSIPKYLKIRLNKKKVNNDSHNNNDDSHSDNDNNSLNAIDREFDQDDSDAESEDVCLYDAKTGECYNDEEELVSDIRCKRNKRYHCVPRSKLCIKYKYLEKV